MPGRSSIQPNKKSDKKITKQLPRREVTAEEMLRSTSTGAASATSSTSDLFPQFSSNIAEEGVETPSVNQMIQSLDARVDPPSTASHPNAWRFPYLLDIFNSCYHRWVS